MSLDITVHHIIGAGLSAVVPQPANSNDDLSWMTPLLQVTRRIEVLEAERLEAEVDPRAAEREEACVLLSAKAQQYDLPGDTDAARARMFLKTFDALNEIANTAFASVKLARDAMGIDPTEDLADAILTLAEHSKALRARADFAELTAKGLVDELEQHETVLEAKNAALQQTAGENIGLDREIALLRTELSAARAEVASLSDIAALTQVNLDARLVPIDATIPRHARLTAASLSDNDGITAPVHPEPGYRALEAGGFRPLGQPPAQIPEYVHAAERNARDQAAIALVWTEERKQLAFRLYTSSDPFYLMDDIMRQLQALPGGEMTSKASIAATVGKMGGKRPILLHQDAKLGIR